jgi:hypothetical protein
MMIPQLFDILLDRPKELQEASAAARAGNDELLARYIFEASRFYTVQLCADGAEWISFRLDDRPK